MDNNIKKLQSECLRLAREIKEAYNTLDIPVDDTDNEILDTYITDIMNINSYLLLYENDPIFRFY